MKFICRGKTAVHAQANWDWSQLFLPDAKSQMYTHSSFPLPKPEVSNFIEFINNLAKNAFPQPPPPENLIQLVQVDQEICILNNNTPTPPFFSP